MKDWLTKETYTLWLNFNPTDKICALPVEESQSTDRSHTKEMATINA